MQGIQPHNLSNNELLRYIYIMGFDKVPEEWVKELVKRFANLLDDNK
jgi:hypothetical protein